MNVHDDNGSADTPMLKSLNRPVVVGIHSLYTALDHCIQQDGLMSQHEFDRMRYIVRKLFDLEAADSCDRSRTIVATTRQVMPLDISLH